MDKSIISTTIELSIAFNFPSLGVGLGGRSCGHRVRGGRMVFENRSPDRHERPEHPFIAIGVLLEVVDRIAIVKSPDAVHQFAIVFHRRQLPTYARKGQWN